MEQPLLPSPAAACASSPSNPTAKSSSSNVLLGLTFFLVLAAFSLWANYEASKGFEVVVVNAAPQTAAGRRFGLFFVSNGRATRLVLAASDSAQRVLYPDISFPRKPVERVTLYMAGHDLNDTVAVVAGPGAGEFVVWMSPAVMGAADVQASVASVVQRGVARVWLRDGRGKAPESVLDAMAEYLAVPSGAVFPSVRPGNVSASLPSASCWAEDDCGGVANFLRYCEMKQHGFVARLNRAMQEEWSEHMVDDALGSSSALLCSAYLSLLHLHQDVRTNVELE